MLSIFYRYTDYYYFNYLVLSLILKNVIMLEQFEKFEIENPKVIYGGLTTVEYIIILAD